MDPLSVTASLLAILGAVTVTLETISSIHSAPKELHALLKELSSIQTVFCNVKGIFDSRLAGDIKARGHTHLLLELSERAQIKLNEIDGLMKTAGLSSINGDEDISKLPKLAQLGWLKVKKRIKALREELREIRLQFIALVGNLTR
jgi:hypothetical protein